MQEHLRNIIYMARRFKLATFFNMLGLVLGFACFYLFMTQIVYQATYNHDITDYKRLYRMESNFVFNEWQYTDNVPRPFAMALERMPQVESYSLTLNTSTGGFEEAYIFPFKKGDREFRYTLSEGNNKAVSTLTDKRLSGEIEWTDTAQDGYIIPASIAMEYFGTTNVKDSMELIYDDGETTEIYKFPVRGVYEDFPENSELVNCIYRNMQGADSLSLNSTYHCIVKFKHLPDDMEAFGDSLKSKIIDQLTKGYLHTEYEDEIPTVIQSVNETTIKFTPIKDSFFEHSTFTTGPSGFKSIFSTMQLSCLLIIIIVTINFLNFMMVESPMRIRSINTRLVLGASRRSLRMGMVMECVITSLIACALALVICYLVQYLPPVRNLIVGSAALTDHWLTVLFMIVIAVIVGITGGYYPATYATSHAPAMALKSNFGLSPEGKKLRTVLLCLQMILAMFLIIYSGIMCSQVWYILKSHYGYDRDQLLVVNLPYSPNGNLHTDIYNELMQMRGVEAASFSSILLGSTDGHYALRTEKDGKTVRYCYMTVDENYMTTMGIKVIKGRPISPSDTMAVIVNEAATKEWKWLKLGTRISTGIDSERSDSATVVGVCENIRYGTTRIVNDKPFFFIYDPDSYNNCLNIRIAPDADKKEISRQISEMVQKHIKEKNSGQNISRPVNINYFNTRLQDIYKEEFRYFKQMLFISIFCLIITLIGVFCLTLFEIEYRRKEIGIRKVAGATTGEIVMMLCRIYGWLIIISFAVAAPIAFFIGTNTLAYFNERTPIHWWWGSLLALLIVGGLTLGTVIPQSWRIARENPVNSIKSD